MSRNSEVQQALLRTRIAQARSQAGAATIGPRAGSGPAELSFAQQRLWFLDQMVPGNPFYNIPSALPLRLALDEGALRRALAAIVQRHESLRTTFVATPDGPRQVIGAAYQALGDTVDLSTLAPPARQEELERLATHAARAPFDLSSGPLLRASLLRLGPSDYVLLMTMHHIVSDGWSMGVLLREIMQLYAEFTSGRPSPLAPLPIQYVDYAAWQRAALTPQRIEALLDYWRGQLANLPTLNLVADRPRPRMPSFAGAFLDVAYDQALSEALARLAHRHEATLFQVLLAGFKAVLARFAGQTDIVVGAPIANRTRPELEGLVGFFVNTLVLRTDLARDPAFSEIVARVRRSTIAAYEHQDLPFEKLVEQLQPVRDMSRNPLAQVTFQIQNAPGAVREKPQGLDQVVRIERATAIFDMAFSLWETRTGLVGGIEFATDIFDAATVRQLAASLECVLRAAVADDTLRLSALPLQTPEQRAATRALLRGVDMPLPAQDLFGAFEAAANAAPDEVVLVDGPGTVTRASLLEEANALAGSLNARGVEAGRTVALVLPRGRRFVALMLATVRCGAAWLAIDPAWPAARINKILDVAQPCLVLREDDEIAQAEAASPRSPVDPGAPAYVLFTSGSTGTPKGVLVSHRALLNHMAWMRAALPQSAAGGRVLQRTPLHFDAAVWELWAPLLGDGVLLLPAPFEAADTGRLCAEIAACQASVLQIVPSLLRVLLDDPAVGRCTSLRRLCIGGEALDGALLAKVWRRWPAIDVVNLYGPTETTIDATSWVADRAWPAEAGAPVGRPIANLQASIVDDHGTTLPPGVVGELCFSGAGLANGYLGGSPLDAARFCTNADGEGIYRTGDLAWARHDGLMFVAGRRDQQVKVRGIRVELGDIEAALASHPAVQGAVVLTVKDELDANALVAFVSMDGGAARIDGANVEALEHGHVDEWRVLYQSVYDLNAAPTAETSFDTVGWTSSYDGRPIVAPAMREWLDATVARLAVLRPRRVLEIGCGAGLIVRALAPRCQRYVASDFSDGALVRARQALEGPGAATGLGNLRLVRCAAHEVGTLGEQGFDTVILNSVVQYFPSPDYFLDVLGQAARLLSPGGRVFIGDVRHHGLLEAFHADVQVARAPADASCGALRERIRGAVAQDKELLLAPSLFWRLADSLPSFGRVAVRLKRGAVFSEMLAFRYDVVLEAGPPVKPPSVAWHDWRRVGFALATLAQWLTGQEGALGLGAIPNARVDRGAGLAAAFSTAADDLPLAQLTLPAPGGVDPEALAQAAQAAGWSVELLPSPIDPGDFVAVLHRGMLSQYEADAALLARHPPASGRLASNPLLATIGPALERVLKAHLAEQLPAPLIPARIEPLAQLPLLANGKVDRAALAPLALRRAGERTMLAAPEGALEVLLAGIWAGVLRLTKVGALDHFFNDLGGHSLLATQVVGRVREALDIDVALRLLFEHPTVRTFAQALCAAQTATQHDPTHLERLAALVLEVNAMDDDALDQLLATEGDHHG